jgi:tetratricopeptide (TPR) repeat protein
VVRANENAMRVVNQLRAQRGLPPGVCGHYNEWLAYGYQQLGRFRDAAQVVEQCLNSPAAQPSDAVEGAAGMRAAYLIDRRDWSGPFVEEPVINEGGPAVVAYLAFGTGYAAAKRGDRTLAGAALARLEAATAQLNEQFRPYGQILGLELSALVQATAGDSARAIALVRQAAALDDDQPMPFGPPWTIKPPHELLGELLLATGHTEEARSEFSAALARTPRRPLAVEGLMQSQAASGHPLEAEASRAELRLLRRQADPGVSP